MLIKKSSVRSSASFICDHSNNSVTTNISSVNIFMWAYIGCSSHLHSINRFTLPYLTHICEFQLRKSKSKKKVKFREKL